MTDIAIRSVRDQLFGRKTRVGYPTRSDRRALSERVGQSSENQLFREARVASGRFDPEIKKEREFEIDQRDDEGHFVKSSAAPTPRRRASQAALASRCAAPPRAEARRLPAGPALRASRASPTSATWTGSGRTPGASCASETPRGAARSRQSSGTAPCTRGRSSPACQWPG